MYSYKQSVSQLIAPLLNDIEEQTILSYLEYPPNEEMGDLSLPCFKLSKQLRQSPQAIAEKLKEQLSASFISKVDAVSGYLNIHLKRDIVASDTISAIMSLGSNYGSQKIGEGKVVVIDFSSPNIAKPFHIGHLRSTVIGHALYRIHQFLGYKVVGVNHLGDWGTQFGKLIVAYQLWGDKARIEEHAIDELLALYVKFHEEAEKQPELEDLAREWFTKIERGNEEALQLWKWFADISLKEFNKIYELLQVKFDYFTGESFYNDKLADTIAELEQKNLLEEDEGAKIVRLDAYDMSPALMLKKDGSSLYHTRDVAAALYRKNTFNFDKVLYVTDYAQTLHFKQWFKVIELMGYSWSNQLIHVPFGRVSLEGAGLSTRKGNVLKLEELLEQSIDKVLDIINAKNVELENKEEVAKQIGVGAVIFNDLSHGRIKDIDFSWDTALNFEGETGPYVQYTYARACSVLRKANLTLDELKTTSVVLDEQILTDTAYRLIKQLALFTERVEQAMDKLEPSIVSRYLVELAQQFNRFYHDNMILVEDEVIKHARLVIVTSTIQTIKTGLSLIGLSAPEQI